MAEVFLYMEQKCLRPEPALPLICSIYWNASANLIPRVRSSLPSLLNDASGVSTLGSQEPNATLPGAPKSTSRSRQNHCAGAPF